MFFCLQWDNFNDFFLFCRQWLWNVFSQPAGVTKVNVFFASNGVSLMIVFLFLPPMVGCFKWFFFFIPNGGHFNLHFFHHQWGFISNDFFLPPMGTHFKWIFSSPQWGVTSSDIFSTTNGGSFHMICFSTTNGGSLQVIFSPTPKGGSLQVTFFSPPMGVQYKWWFFHHQWGFNSNEFFVTPSGG